MINRNIILNLIKKLHKETGVNLIECKKILIKIDYNYIKAINYIYKNNLNKEKK